ncbi:MAG: hypothetical protein ABSB00_00310 [Minisyncoccia bacterium]|jgi:1-aminocyclopropane-1-carboxylate deaminase/D-cysteine desulfhydrase-like pyridoxal-dependent ACC family enzyme
MRNSRSRSHLPFSLTTFCCCAVAVLAVAYLGLIAIVMSYAALTIEFSQSVKNDEAVVATLEQQYLSIVSQITNTDYAAAGYALPVAEIFVPAKDVTALR